ncbi:MAG: hypothetical protein ACRC8J_03695, partial [Phocaeicola sp.]
DIKKYVKLYLQQYYPVSSSLLEAYYLSLEDRVIENKIVLPYYEGIEAISKSYLYPDEFEYFYAQLDKISKSTTDNERKRLNEMLTAMQFTRLELMRMNTSAYSSEKIEETLTLLKGHEVFSNMKRFKESGGSLKSYIDQLENLRTVNMGKDNLLKNSTLKLVDANNTSLPILTDGHYGLSIDYYLGWYISAKESISVSIPLFEGVNTYRIKIGMMQAKEWNIYIPQRIEIWSKNGCLSSFPINSLYNEQDSCRIMSEVIIQLDASDLPLELRIRNNASANAKIAIDEIEMYKYNQ